MHTIILRFITLSCAFLLCSSLPFALADDAQKPPANHAVVEDQSILGTVTETMNSGGYTYLLVNSESQNTWVAIPETTVSVGQKVICLPGMEMIEFTSKTLKRTFASIIFSPGLAENTEKTIVVSSPQENKATSGDTREETKQDSFAAALQAEQKQAQNPHGIELADQSGGSMGAVVPMAEIQIEKAADDASYTVAECFEQAASLDGKNIVVRGKVMKVSPKIMGRNWVHIQDGTGNPMNNSHDLVVTTQDMPEQDSIITVSGTLHANRDFGAGYKYAAIIENASIQ